MKRILFCLFLLMSFSTIYATNYNYTVDCITDSSGNIVNSTDEISENDKYSVVQKEFKNISDSSNTFLCIGKLVKKESAIVPLDTSASYIGYYADVDDDGTVDGVIFADLAFSKSGIWNTDTPSNSTSNKNGTYSYTAQTGLKEYYISQESYKGKFGTKPVISPVSGTTGNDRFYVMALSDFTTSSYSSWYWYKAAYGKISNYSTITSQNFGSGKQNTANMISKWNSSAYGSQNTRDIWNAIQTQVNNGWFVPSSKEWAAFGNAFNITSSNFSSYGLSFWYWPSSLFNHDDAYCVGVNEGHIGNNHVNSNSINNKGMCVRLATTY